MKILFRLASAVVLFIAAASICVPGFAKGFFSGVVAPFSFLYGLLSEVLA